VPDGHADAPSVVDEPLPLLGGDPDLPTELGAEDLVLDFEVFKLSDEVPPACGDEQNVKRVESVEYPGMVGP
jgi:hypothetical protein